jgi:type VI secretion system protein
MGFFNKFSHDLQSRSGDQDLLDVLDNLNNVLNTKKGYGSFIEEFGIADMNEYRSREYMAQAIMKEVKRNIELYEPRVQLNEIILVKDDNPTRLSFRINCTIRRNAQSLRMVFDSTFNSFHVDDSAL